MKIRLSKEEKTELLKAVTKGELDTAKIPQITSEIRGKSSFEELLESLTDEELDEEIEDLERKLGRR